MNLDKLLDLAGKATPGPWTAGVETGTEDGVWAEVPTSYDDEPGYLVAWCHSDYRNYADAAFIAAASPEVVTALVRVAQAAQFRASATFTRLDPQPSGPDLLDAIAAYMDRMDDEWEFTHPGQRANREVQADVRRWAVELRAALAEVAG